MNENVGATASPLTISAVERGFSYWDARVPDTSHQFENRYNSPALQNTTGK
ncbi:MAG: hypothetical protein F6J93_33895 [Oscillatoria sp. SIO1A7]|nr:hypothetical protein [Oscillatoria sp. SIO1A7]